MADFTFSTQHLNPYKNFKFRLKLGALYVAGFSKVSMHKLGSEPINYREGGARSSSRKSPERIKYGAITLEHGVTYDTELVKWANSQTPLDNARKEITLEIYDEVGQLTLAYRIYRCWVSEFQSMADLDTSAYSVAIERIKLENDGWLCEYDYV
jgi:phage tail-like protein